MFPSLDAASGFLPNPFGTLLVASRVHQEVTKETGLKLNKAMCEFKQRSAFWDTWDTYPPQGDRVKGRHGKRCGNGV